MGDMKSRLTKRLQPAREGYQAPGNDREADDPELGSGSDRIQPKYAFYNSKDGRNDDTFRQPDLRPNTKPTL